MEDAASTIDPARVAAQQAVRDLRDRVARLGDGEIDLILRDARSHYAWRDTPISDDVLHALFDITIQGPTSMNTCPARFVFVKSADAKDRLAKALKPKNVEKMRAAPMTAIIAWDPEFWQKLDFLFPHEDHVALATLFQTQGDPHPLGPVAMQLPQRFAVGQVD